MMNLAQIARRTLQIEPYLWAEVDNLFSPEDAEALAGSYPFDHYKLVSGYGGEKDYEYHARELIGMGAETISHPEDLSKPWQDLARDFLSSAYREALSTLTGCDLTTAPLEVNVFHYGPRALLGPHCDLPDKVVTHILYFNSSWNREDGGCLSVLRSSDPMDRAAEIVPIVGNSAVLVRSNNSWHAVSRVVDSCSSSRRSLTATFYHPGSVSTMWPPGDTTPLHRYDRPAREPEASRPTGFWQRLLRKR